jgi:hypothetical protein
MEFSPKATRFVIEALERYLPHHDRGLAEEGSSEDNAARQQW